MKSLFRFRPRDGYLFLTSYIGDEEIITVPSTHKGVAVTGVSRDCFYKCDREIKKKIKQIILPDSIELIEQHAFCDCVALRVVVMPKNLEVIKHEVFWNCSSLTTITLHKNVKTVGTGAFKYCDNLKRITCYSDEISLGKDAIPLGLPLEDVSFNLIGKLEPQYQARLIKKLLSKFYTLTAEEQKVIIAFINRKQNLKKELFIIDEGEIISILIEKKIKLQINAVNEFLDYHIKKKNTDIIAMLLEYKEKNFTKKQAEESLERKELVEIGFELPTYGEFRQDWKFFKLDGEITISSYKGVATEQTIPESIADGTPITRLDKNEKSDYTKLEVLKIDAKLTTIEGGTFENCYNLKEVIFPESLEDIYCNAFFYCMSLRSVKFHDKLDYIGDVAFGNCSALREITLSKNLKTIGEKAFIHCMELDNVILYDSLKSIYKDAFYGCKKLKEIIIPKSVTKIGESAFDDCKGLEKVEILGELTILEQATFAHCEKLKEVVLPDTLREIATFTFRNCSSLEEITIPASVIGIDFMAFADCYSLKKVNFLGKKPYISRSAFKGTPLEDEL